ncbi:MAG: ABC transporter permease subunit [Planctomycetota bacterium]|jgi:ABC-type Na+ efflux pump permease subunit
MLPWKVIWAVARKELRAGFRDRQTWIYSVILPLAMYPLLFWVMIQAQQVISGKRDATAVAVEVQWAPERAELGERILAALGEAPSPEPTEERKSPRKLTASTGSWEAPDDARDSLRDKRSGLDLLVWIPAESANEADAESAFSGVELRFDSSRPRGSLAAERVETRLEALARELRAEALEGVGRDGQDLDLFDWRTVNVASSSDVGSFVLSLMLPMMMVIMTVLGAFYPAIDLTAGERERNTEETTRLVPAPRAAVHLGKILAVSATALLATVANLAGIALAGGHLLNMVGGDVEVQLPWINLALMLPLALTFVVFASVVLVSAASLTDSFKQGQSLLGTVQMVFMLPSMATVLPGLVLSPGLAAVPIVGLAIAYRDILRATDLSELPWIQLALTGLFTLVYAALALWLGLRILAAEQLGTSDEGWGARLKTALFGPPAPR